LVTNISIIDNNSLSILLIEDPAYNDSLYRLLKNEFRFAHIFKAKDIDQSLKILKNIRVDIIILTDPISYFDGIEITEIAMKKLPSVQLYVYSEKEFKGFVNNDKVSIEIFNKSVDHPMKVIRTIKEKTQKN
jgi:two-component SAPR family response regulator